MDRIHNDGGPNGDEDDFAKLREVQHVSQQTYEFPFLSLAELEGHVVLLESLPPSALHHDPGYTRHEFQKLVHPLMVNCGRLQSQAGASLVERLLARCLVQQRHDTEQHHRPDYNYDDPEPLPSTIMYNVAMEAWIKAKSNTAGAKRAEEILNLMEGEYDQAESRRREARGDYERHRLTGAADSSSLSLPPSLPQRAAAPDLINYSTVLKAWARSGSGGRGAVQAQRLFDVIPNPDPVCFHICMEAWAKSRRRDTVTKVEAMWDRLNETVFNDNHNHNHNDNHTQPIDTRTYTVLIDAYAKTLRYHPPQHKEQTQAYVNRVSELLAEVHRHYKPDPSDIGLKSNNHRTPNTILHNAVLNVFCQAGELIKAERLLEEMTLFPWSKPNTSSYNTVLQGWAKSKNGDRAERLLNHMTIHDDDTSAGVTPDTISYNTVLNAHVQSGDVDRALDFFQTHVIVNRPTVVSFGIVLHALRKHHNHRQRQPDRSRQMLDDMETSYGIVPNARCFQSVLEAYRVAGGRGEEAEILLRRMDTEERYDAPTTYVSNVVLRAQGKNYQATWELCRWMSTKDKESQRPNVDSYNIVLDACWETIRTSSTSSVVVTEEADHEPHEQVLHVAMDAYQDLRRLARQSSSSPPDQQGGGRRRRHNNNHPNDATPNPHTYLTLLRIMFGVNKTKVDPKIAREILEGYERVVSQKVFRDTLQELRESSHVNNNKQQQDE